jgi:hypothetical protein
MARIRFSGLMASCCEISFKPHERQHKPDPMTGRLDEPEPDFCGSLGGYITLALIGITAPRYRREWPFSACR